MSSARIPAGSLVLITGAGGLIGSSVAETFLEHGYRVRGTSRSHAGLAQLQTDFRARFGADSFEIAVVHDIAAPGAYDEAIKGVSAVVHLATDNSFSAEYDLVVGTAVNATVNLLNTAAAQSTIKAFTLTSSRVAAFHAESGDDLHVTDKSWNEAVLKSAKETTGPAQGGHVYMASKLEGERAAWAFVKEHKPPFAFTAILPDYVLGAYVNSTGSGGKTPSLLRQWIETGEAGLFGLIIQVPSQSVHVRDVALLHYAATVDADVVNERLFATTNAPWGSTEILAAAAELFPDRKLPADLTGLPPRAKIHVANDRSLEILKRQGRSDWRTLKEGIADTLN